MLSSPLRLLSTQTSESMALLKGARGPGDGKGGGQGGNQRGRRGGGGRGQLYARGGVNKGSGGRDSSRGRGRGEKKCPQEFLKITTQDSDMSTPTVGGFKLMGLDLEKEGWGILSWQTCTEGEGSLKDLSVYHGACNVHGCLHKEYLVKSS